MNRIYANQAGNVYILQAINGGRRGMNHDDVAVIAVAAYRSTQLKNSARQKCSRKEQATLVVRRSICKLERGDDVQ